MMRTVLEWLAFFLLMGFGIYTLWVIKNEKKNYLKNPKKMRLKKILLLVPQWWGEGPGETIDELRFKRLDTNIQWEARFRWFEERSSKGIIDLFKEKIEERKILFDAENCIIHSPSDFEKSPLVLTGRYEMLRLEGTATLEQSERIYYDAFLVRELETGQYLYAESKSSVLSGLVEGPYFEEVMKKIQVAT